ncbi:MAG TPA: PKD domain-containing protein [Bacteroidales bacterium]|nr:PKD domain-containing protein [Bacteroidales bacterium]HSA42875.1 PKD domain-containing protein [Bacteroidales bacterium]
MKSLPFMILGLIVTLSAPAKAGKYYWVGNGGTWTELSHWATSSNGDVFHTSVPGLNDTVYFDSFSFDQNGQTVFLDLIQAECAMMDWQGIDEYVAFAGWDYSTMYVHGSCILSEKLSFNFPGNLQIQVPGPGITDLNFSGQVLDCDLTLNIDSAFLSGDLKLPFNKLVLQNGILFTNGHSVDCGYFNTDSSLKHSVTVTDARWIGNDSLTVRGSIALADSLSFRQSGPLIFTFNAADSNYITANSDTLHCNVVFRGGKKVFLNSALTVGGSIAFKGGGMFFSEGHSISTTRISSVSSLNRSIHLGSSAITLSGPGLPLDLYPQGLNLVSANSSLHFTYTGPDTISINTEHDYPYAFREVHFPSSNIMVFNSITTSWLTMDTSANLALARGITITVDSLRNKGNCGKFSHIRAFCRDCPLCTAFNDCPTPRPLIHCNASPIVVEYLKIKNMETSGAGFTANQSYDEGNNSGFVIHEPNTAGTYYWINGSGDWNDPEHWSETSGGTAGSCLPTRRTNVVFDVASGIGGDTISIRDFAYCKDITWNVSTGNGYLAGSGVLDVSGNIRFTGKTHVSVAGGLTLHTADSDTCNISAKASDFTCDIRFDGSGHWVLSDTLMLAGKLALQQGHLYLKSFPLTCHALLAGGQQERTLNYSGSAIVLTGADTVWNSSGNSITLHHDTASIRLTGQNTGYQVFVTGGKSFDTLDIQSPKVRFVNGADFELLRIEGGAVLECEPLSTIRFDSLYLSGTCANPVTISSYHYASDSVIFSWNKANDSLHVSNVIIRNVCADTSGGRKYNALNSFGLNRYSGWNIVDTVTGQTFYWTGLSSVSWNDLNNWEVTGNPFNDCLPGISDRVIFDSAYLSAAGSHDTIVIEKFACCKSLIWDQPIPGKAAFILGADLIISDTLILSDSLHFSYPQGLHPVEPDVPLLILAPQSADMTFNPRSSTTHVNLSVQGKEYSNSVQLAADFSAGPLCSIRFTSGGFKANAYQVSADFISSDGSCQKQVDFENSQITAGYSFVMQDTAVLNLNMTSSRLIMKENIYYSNWFSGGSQQYHTVEFRGADTSSYLADYTSFIEGSNTFGLLTIDTGLYMVLESGTTQTLDSIVLNGTCRDSVFLRSSAPSIPAILNKTTGDSIRGTCLNITDIIVEGKGASALFSKKYGTSTGWYVNSSKRTIAGFLPPPTSCLKDSLQFINTSTCFQGNPTNLTYLWNFGDGTKSALFEPAHQFAIESKYKVSLLASDTVTGCTDMFIDSITTYNPLVYLSSTRPDTNICQGDLVEFTATFNNPDPSFQFMVAGNPVIPPPDSSHFSTASLVNGDLVYVILNDHGCIDTSNAFAFNVNQTPEVHLLTNIPGNTICSGDTITITGLGTDIYQLYLNGSGIDSLSTVNQWVLTELITGDVLTLYGQDASTGCGSLSIDSLILTVNPLPALSLACIPADLTICSGTPVFFQAGGAELYRFFLNGNPVGPVSATDTLTLTTLGNGDIVSVQGISAEGCMAFDHSNLVFSVLATPLVTLSCSDPDLRICKGEMVSFQAFGADEYQFSLNGDSLGPFSLLSSYTTDSLSTGQTVAVSGKLGSCLGHVISPLTMDVRPVITWSYSSQEICANDSITFIARGDSVYHFSVDGVLQQSGYDSVFVASGLTDGQQLSVNGTEYACVPDPLTVLVHPVPTATMLCSEPDTALCEGNAITFTGNGGFLYSFYVDNVQILPFSPVNTFTSTTLTDGQVVTMEALSSYQCRGMSADTFIVTIWPNPVVSLIQNEPGLTICAGDTLSFTAGGASLYQFFVNGTAQGQPAPDSTFSTFSLTNGAIVSVTGTSGNCSVTSDDTYTFTVNPLPVVTLTALTPLSYCTGDTLILLATGASGYEFFIDGISTGPPSGNSIFSSSSLSDGQTVSVTGFQNNCASAGNIAYTVTIHDYPSLSVTSNLAAPEICYGDTVVFQAGGAQNYIFYLDNVAVSWDSVYVAIGLEQGQTITIQGGNGNCWLDADTSYTINVNYLYLTLVSSQPSNVFCEGSQVNFIASGADLYEFFVDGISQGPPSSNSSFTATSPSLGQFISVAGTSLASGCTQKATGDIMAHPLPLPQITVSPSPVFCEGDSALLQCSVSEGLQWYRDGISITGANSPELFVFSDGSYSVASASGGDGVVFSVGANNSGQLGNGTFVNSLIFNNTTNTSDISMLACGQAFTLALVNGGQVWSWGRNEFGALGNGTYTDSPTPVQAGNIQTATKIDAGARFGAALLADSTLLAWGENTYGQLGYGNFSTSNFPFPVSGISRLVDVAAGEDHCLALDADGKVWAWGRNQYGQLGDSSLITRNEPVEVKGIGSVIAVRAGGNHSLALKNDGSLWIWGANQSGQLGNGTYDGSLVPIRVNLPLPIASFDGGFVHTVAADTAGHVYTWGNNDFGQIGNQSFTPELYPVRIPKAGKARKVKAGSYATYVIRSDDHVFSWGSNNHGQLGLLNTDTVSAPEAVTSLFGILDIDGGQEHCAALSGQEFSCSSSNMLIQVDTTPPVPLYLDGTTLYTTALGVSYQWYYQGSVIPGANSNTLNVGAEGIYKLEVVFSNDCPGFSDEFGFYVGLNEAVNESSVMVYPNPSEGSFVIGLTAASHNALKLREIKVLDMLGQCLFRQENDGSSDKIMINLSSFPCAVYTMELRFGDAVLVHKPVVIAY